MQFEEVTRFSNQRGLVPEEWRQGRAAYGGAMAAAGVRAMRTLIPPERKLRYFNAQFVAAAGPGEIELRASELAHGGSVSNAQASFFSDGQLCLQMTAVFAAARFSSKALSPHDSKPDPHGEGARAMPYIEGITPQFTRHIDYRWLEGGMPFSGTGEALVSGFCRHKTQSGSADEAAIGLLDAWPPSVLPLLDRPSPASTVSWSAHFYEPPTADPQAWWFYRARPLSFQEGYATEEAHLYAPDGRLVAWSEQLVAVYEKSAEKSHYLYKNP